MIGREPFKFKSALTGLKAGSKNSPFQNTVMVVTSQIVSVYWIQTGDLTN